MQQNKMALKDHLVIVGNRQSQRTKRERVFPTPGWGLSPECRIRKLSWHLNPFGQSLPLTEDEPEAWSSFVIHVVRV
jgi:hypothetical protein